MTIRKIHIHVKKTKRYNDRSPEDDLEISSDEHALHFYLGSNIILILLRLLVLSFYHVYHIV